MEANARKLDHAVDLSNDRRFEYFGLRTVYDRYLLRHPDTRHGHGDPAVLPAARRLRPVAHTAGGDRLLPPDGVTGLPAQLADALQLRHPAHPDVVVLPRGLSAGRARVDLRPLRAGRQAVEVRWWHRHLVVPGAVARRAHPRHQRPLQRHRPVAAHPRLVGLGGQPGRPPQGGRLRLPRAVAPRHRGVPRAARQHGRGRPAHPQPQPRQLGPRRVHAPGRGRRAVEPHRPPRGARAARPLGAGLRGGVCRRGAGRALRAPGQRARALRQDDADPGPDRQRLDDVQGRQQPDLQPDQRRAGARARRSSTSPTSAPRSSRSPATTRRPSATSARSTWPST